MSQRRYNKLHFLSNFLLFYVFFVSGDGSQSKLLYVQVWRILQTSRLEVSVVLDLTVADASVELNTDQHTLVWQVWPAVKTESCRGLSRRQMSGERWMERKRGAGNYIFPLLPCQKENLITSVSSHGVLLFWWKFKSQMMLSPLISHNGQVGDIQNLRNTFSDRYFNGKQTLHFSPTWWNV